MIYRPLGQTGKTVSAIGFGGMRFPDIDNRDACHQIIQAALKSGITYFDTAPGYMSGKSEERLGEALEGQAVVLSTKSSKSSGTDLRKDLEASLVRLRRNRLEVFHVWYVSSKDDYQRRVTGGAIQAALSARDEGLVEHVFISTHMAGPDIVDVLTEGPFEGVTLGVSAINAPFRDAAVQAATRLGRAVLCMNPLGGGLIPKRADYFAYLKSPQDRSVVVAALRFVLSLSPATIPLVGFGAVAEVAEAAQAVEPFVPWTPQRLKQLYEHPNPNLDRLCTGCGYCSGCPEKVEIPSLMLAYNRKVMGEPDHAVQASMKYEWRLPLSRAAACIACGVCESKCTQKLPIISRLAEMAMMKELA